MWLLPKGQQVQGEVHPLVPLSIIDVPLKCIAMDIIGPLHHSHSGNKYIVVVGNYASRYPEAMAICSIEAEHIEEELINSSQRVGILE